MNSNMDNFKETVVTDAAPKKAKLPLIIGVSSLLLVAIAAVVLVLMMPKMKLDKAEKLYEDGKTAEAVAILVDLKEDEAEELLADIMAAYCDDFVSFTTDGISAANRYTKTFSTWLTLQAMSGSGSFTLSVDRSNSDVKKMVAASDSISTLRYEYGQVFTEEIVEKLDKDLQKVSQALVKAMTYSSNAMMVHNYETWLFSKFGSGLTATYSIEGMESEIATLANAVSKYLD